MPETLTCTLDIRHPELDSLDWLEGRVRAIVAEQGERLGVGVGVVCQNDSPPVHFDQRCIDAVQGSVDELGFTNTAMISGAGHDACYVASHCPTSMIFIPCADGLSHNEAELITATQAHQGASVLLNAVHALAS